MSECTNVYHTASLILSFLSHLLSPSLPDSFTAVWVFQAGQGYSTGSLFDFHLTIGHHNMPCSTLQPVSKDVSHLGSQIIISLDQHSPEAEIAFALTQIPPTIHLKIMCF